MDNVRRGFGMTMGVVIALGALLICAIVACFGILAFLSLSGPSTDRVFQNIVTSQASRATLPPLDPPATPTSPGQSPPQEEALPPPTPEPSGPTLEILSSSNYIDDIGYNHIVGEIINHSDQPQEFVKIVATLYDDAGNITGTDFTFTELDTIPPGGKSPFEVTIDEWEGTTNFKLQAESNPGSMPRQDLVINSHRQFIDDIGYLHIQGEAQNTGSAPAEFVKIIITLYDANGEVMNTDFTFTDLDTLPPGGSSPFETSIQYHQGFARYEVQIEGR